jgi:hypothetical protein
MPTTCTTQILQEMLSLLQNNFPCDRTISIWKKELHKDLFVNMDQ